MTWLAGAAVAQLPADRVRRIEEALPATVQAAPRRPRRVLIFNTPPHLMAKDPHRGYCIPYGVYAFQMLGKKTGAYEAVISDDLAMFLPDRISQFDAIVLNTTSNAWITPTEEQGAIEPLSKVGSDVEAVEGVLRKSLLEYVRGGGGLLGIHFATGANRHWPEFAETPKGHLAVQVHKGPPMKVQFRNVRIRQF